MTCDTSLINMETIRKCSFDDIYNSNRLSVLRHMSSLIILVKFENSVNESHHHLQNQKRAVFLCLVVSHKQAYHRCLCISSK